jgi:pimeloyl-ACP methyl ester carboxylesterase
MPFTNNAIDGTKIHYEVEGSGPLLVLVHGFSGSLHGWQDYGYVDALKKRLPAGDERRARPRR